MLYKAGIETVSQLLELGAIAAYVQIQRVGLNPSLNLLWALEGAVSDRDWKDIAQTKHTSLLLALEDHQK